MALTLTWDLFIIVFFALVLAYSFIIGKHETVKVVIATYIATVAVEGIGNIFTRLTGETTPILNVIGIGVDVKMLTAFKLFAFVALIIFIAVKAGMEVDYQKEYGGIVNAIITGCFGFVTAGLLLSILLTFVADVPLLDQTLAQSDAMSPMIAESKLMQVMVLNQDLWFALPALLMIAVGFISNEDTE